MSIDTRDVASGQSTTVGADVLTKDRPTSTKVADDAPHAVGARDHRVTLVFCACTAIVLGSSSACARLRERASQTKCVLMPATGGQASRPGA